MRKSGYRTVFHIYLIFFLAMLGAILAASGLLFLLITVRRPDGSLARSNWPQTFAGEFREEIMFDGGAVRVSREGIRLLRDNGGFLRRGHRQLPEAGAGPGDLFARGFAAP